MSTTACQSCSRIFKRISMHKCKQVLVQIQTIAVRQEIILPVFQSVYERITMIYEKDSEETEVILSGEEQTIKEMQEAKLLQPIPQKHQSMALQLIKQHNIVSYQDLYEHICMQIQMLWEKKSYRIYHFAVNLEQIKDSFSYFEQKLYSHGDYFIPSYGNWIQIDHSLKYKKSRAQEYRQHYNGSIEIFKLLSYNGINPPNKDSITEVGVLKEQLDIALFQYKQNSNKSNFGIFELQHINKYSTTRSIKCLPIQEIQNLIGQKKCAVDNVICSRISEQCIFYADIDIKQNLGKIDDQDRRHFLITLEKAMRKVLRMYNNYDNVQIETISKDPLQSCHIYTDSLVKVKDLRNIRGLIIQFLINEGYNKKQLDNVYDAMPYPVGDKYSTLRFPTSDKIELPKQAKQQESDSDSDNDDKPVIKLSPRFLGKQATYTGDLSQFIICSKARFQVQIVDNPFFDNSMPFPLSKHERGDYEPDEEEEELSSQSMEDFISRKTDEWNYQINKENKIIYEGDCPICNEHHGSVGNRVLLVWKCQQFVQIMCVKSRQTMKFNKDATKQANVLDSHEYTLEEQFLPNYSKARDDFYFNISSCKMTFVKASPGSGKTYQAIRNIKNLLAENPKLRVLFLSTRISFSRSLVAQFKQQYEIEFDLYSEINDADINKSQFLMIQIESLQRLNQVSSKYDVIIIDEAISVLNQIQSGCADQTAILITLCRQITKCEHVLVMDAFLNMQTVVFYKYLDQKNRNQSQQIIYNKFKPYSGKKANIYLPTGSYQNQEEQYLSKLSEQFKTNRRIFSFISERRKMKKMVARVLKDKRFNLKAKDILILHGDNMEEVTFNEKNMLHVKQKAEIYADISQFGNYKLVIFTKTLTCGIDSQHSEFTCGVHLLTQKYTKAFEFVQAIHRFRKVENQQIFIEETYINNPDIIKHQLTPHQECVQIIRACDQIKIVESFDELTARYRILQDVQNQQQRQQSIQIIEAFLQDLGWRLKIKRLDAKQPQQENQKIEWNSVILNFDNVELCKQIQQKGTNILINTKEERIPEHIKDIYHKYQVTRKFLLNYKQADLITIQDIIDHQNIAIESKIGSQIQLVEQAKSIINLRGIDDWNLQTTFNKDLSMICGALITSSEKIDVQIQEIEWKKKLLLKILFLSFLRVNGKKLSDNIQGINSKYNGLKDIETPKELLEKICSMLNLRSNFDSNKMVAEFIKKCGLEVCSKQIRVDGKQERLRTLVISNPTLPQLQFSEIKDPQY